MRNENKVAYYPDEGPVWLIARSLQVVSNMATFAEEDKEPHLDTSIQGVAQFRDGLLIGDTDTYTREVRFYISGLNYKDIVEHRKQAIEQYGVGDDISLYCNDKLGTVAELHHTYAEYSEVGQLWDESWEVKLVVPDNLMQQLLDAIQFDRIDLIEIGLMLSGVYTNKAPDGIRLPGEQSMLFLEPPDDKRIGERAFGYVDSLGMGSTKRATRILEEELLEQGLQPKGTSDYLDSDAHLNEAQIGSILLTKLHAVQTFLKTIKTTLYIVVILLLCVLLWLAA